MNTIFIIALEPLDTRYTGQWFTGIPNLLNTEIYSRGLSNQYQVVQIAGKIIDNAKTTDGAFLNFAATNIWKSEQAIEIAKLFSTGKVVTGDKFLFTDLWNPTIIQTKYMSELLDIPVEIHSIAHAGSYDPQDFLGRKVKDKRWSYNAERAFYEASDFNYFATGFHHKLLRETLFGDSHFTQKDVISGQPHGLLAQKLVQYHRTPKRDLVLFPHRVAPEKQPEIFRDLSTHFPDVEFVICQEQNLSKDEYHMLLGEAKVVFSANLQETLGISTAIEAPLVRALPLVPDRLSYTEIFEGFNDFLMPSEWTESFESYEANRVRVISKLRYMLHNYDALAVETDRYRTTRWGDYGSAGPMIQKILGV